MNKFYIDYNNGRRYYAYKYENDRINYISLNEKEIITLLSKITENKIKNIIDNDKVMEIAFENNFSLVIDNTKIFLMQQDSYDHYFFKLLNRIKRFIEPKNITEIKKSKHVNRIKSKRMPKAIIAGTLSVSLSISLLAGMMNKELSKSDKIATLPNINYEMNLKEVPKANLKEFSLEPTIENQADFAVKLAFKDRTESNRIDTNTTKLEETEMYFKDSILKYCTRYGIPYDLAWAQITQERPNIKNGVCENVCQITYSLFVGQTMTVPIYNNEGFTGEYETFEITKELLDTPDGNIKVGLAYLRTCIDKFDSLILGLFSYNQGEFALGIACDYYGLNKEDYFTDENAIKARDLINRYYEEQNKNHGDSMYLENVFSYLDLGERGSINLEYYLGSEKKTVEIINTLVYNNELSR